MTNKDKQQNDQDGGVLPKPDDNKATPMLGVRKPKPTKKQKDVRMGERHGTRTIVQPQRFVPGSKKSRGPLTEEQKAARAAKRAMTSAVQQAGPSVPVVPTQEELDRIRREQAIAARAAEILANQMQEDAKRPSRAAKSKTEEDSRRKAAFAQATKEFMRERREGRQTLSTSVDALADIFGQMTTSRPSGHSSGHAIFDYDPKDGWPRGVNPVTGQVERFATREGGKKKRVNKKASKKGGEGEENELSLPVTNKIQTPAQRVEELAERAAAAQQAEEAAAEAAAIVAEAAPALPALPSEKAAAAAPMNTVDFDGMGGKKKRTNNKKKSQKGGEVEGAVAEDSKSQAAPLSGGKKKRTNKNK